MSRSKGIYPFPVNFELESAAPLDAKTLCSSVSALTGLSTWQTVGDTGNANVYKGMIVSVFDDPVPSNNTIWTLTSGGNGYQDINNWKKIFSVEDANSNFVNVTGDTMTGGLSAPSVHTVSIYKNTPEPFISGFTTSTCDSGPAFLFTINDLPAGLTYGTDYVIQASTDGFSTTTDLDSCEVTYNNPNYLVKILLSLLPAGSPQFRVAAYYPANIYGNWKFNDSLIVNNTITSQNLTTTSSISSPSISAANFYGNMNGYLPLAGGQVGNLFVNVLYEWSSPSARLISIINGTFDGSLPWSFTKQPTIPGYLTSTDATATYLPLTGGTINGDLVVSDNLTVNTSISSPGISADYIKVNQIDITNLEIQGYTVSGDLVVSDNLTVNTSISTPNISASSINTTSITADDITFNNYIADPSNVALSTNLYLTLTVNGSAFGIPLSKLPFTLSTPIGEYTVP